MSASHKNGSEHESYVTRAEFDNLLTEVSDLTTSLRHLADTLDRHFGTLLATVSGQTPDKCVPLETHKKVVTGLITAFSVIVVVAVGAVKLLPVVLGIPH